MATAALPFCEHARVGELMARRRRTEGHEDRRPAGGGELRDGHGARPGRPRGPPRPSPPGASGRNGTSFQFAGIRGYRWRVATRSFSPVWWITSRPDFSRSTAARAIAAVHDARALAAAEDEEAPRRRRRVERRDLEELRRTGVPVTIAGLLEPGVRRRRSPTAVRVAKRLRNRLARPGRALDSWISVGMPSDRAAVRTGTAT